MAASLLKVTKALPLSNSENDDDGIDRLNHRYTSTLLILFSVLITTNTYVGASIKCWPPKYFTKPWVNYVHNYCWVKGTHYVPLEPGVDIPKEHEEKDILPYYQWLPIILLAQALLFTVPYQLWRMFNGQSGIDVTSIIQASESYHNSTDEDKRSKTLTNITSVLDRYFTSGYKQRPGFEFSVLSCVRIVMWPFCGQHKNNSLILFYLFIKLLYIANAIGQLFILDYVLDTNYHSYGVDVIQSSLAGREWAPTTSFPRVTMCDFKIRRLGDNIHRYVVQCALPVNLFNERVYLIIWFWFVIVAAITVYSFIEWLIRGSSRSQRHSYIAKHLVLTDLEEGDVTLEHLIQFARDYLGPDGVTILKLISKNTDAYTVVDIIQKLWKAYMSKYKDDDDSIEMKPQIV